MHDGNIVIGIGPSHWEVSWGVGSHGTHICCMFPERIQSCCVMQWRALVACFCVETSSVWLPPVAYVSVGVCCWFRLYGRTGKDPVWFRRTGL